MKTRALVTGGAGFIGSHVAEYLADLGVETVVLDDLSGGFRENVPANAIFVKGSILDENLIHELFQQYQFDYVYHLAAYAAEGLSHFIRRFNYNNNLIGSINLINASIKADVKCFVFTSSIAVYGAAKPPVTEESACFPEDPYGVAKLAVEQDLKAAHEMFGLPYIVFRPHNVYGERQNIGDRYRNVVGIFLNQIMQDLPMTVFGDGEQMRAFSHIDDVAPIIADSVNVPEALNQSFNIGADVPFSVNVLAEEAARAMGVPTNVQYLEARNEVAVIFADHSKCERVFGRPATVGLRDGLERMSGWAKTHGARESSRFENIEVSKNMPPSWVSITS